MTIQKKHHHSQGHKELANKAAWNQHKRKRLLKKVLLASTITIAVFLIVLVSVLYSIE